MKIYLISVLSAVLFAPAASAENAPPLAPGKPAGTRAAQLESGQGMIIVAAASLAGMGIALATADDGPQANNTRPAASVTTGSTP